MTKRGAVCPRFPANHMALFRNGCGGKTKYPGNKKGCFKNASGPERSEAVQFAEISQAGGTLNFSNALSSPKNCLKNGLKLPKKAN